MIDETAATSALKQIVFRGVAPRSNIFVHFCYRGNRWDGSLIFNFDGLLSDFLGDRNRGLPLRRLIEVIIILRFTDCCFIYILLLIGRRIKAVGRWLEFFNLLILLAILDRP